MNQANETTPTPAGWGRYPVHLPPVRVDPDLARQVQDHAARAGLSVSELVRLALAAAVTTPESEAVT